MAPDSTEKILRKIVQSGPASFVIGIDTSGSWGVLGRSAVFAPPGGRALLGPFDKVKEAGGPITRVIDYRRDDAALSPLTRSHLDNHEGGRLNEGKSFFDTQGLLKLIVADLERVECQVDGETRFMQRNNDHASVEVPEYRTRYVPRYNVHAAMMIASIDDMGDMYGGNIRGHTSAKYFGMSDQVQRFLEDTKRCGYPRRHLRCSFVRSDAPFVHCSPSDSYVTFAKGGIPTGDGCGGADDWYRGVYFPTCSSAPRRGIFPAPVMDAAASRFTLLVKLGWNKRSGRRAWLPRPGELFAAGSESSFEMFCALESQYSGSSLVVRPEVIDSSTETSRLPEPVGSHIAALQLLRISPPVVSGRKGKGRPINRHAFRGIAQQEVLVPFAQMTRGFGKLSVDTKTGDIITQGNLWRYDRAKTLRLLTKSDVQSRSLYLSSDIADAILRQHGAHPEIIHGRSFDESDSDSDDHSDNSDY